MESIEFAQEVFIVVENHFVNPFMISLPFQCFYSTFFDALLMVVILLYPLTHNVFFLLYSLYSWESINRKRISCGTQIAGKNFCQQRLSTAEIFVIKPEFCHFPPIKSFSIRQNLLEKSYQVNHNSCYWNFVRVFP